MPFFIYLSLGYASKAVLHIKEESFADLNKLAFYTMLSANLFLNIYDTQLSEIRFLPALEFCISAIIVIVTLFWTMYARRKLPPTDKSVLIQGIFRTNFILFGIPLTERILGHPSSGLAGILTAVIIPSFNILAVIVLAIYSGKKASVFDVLKNIAKNPLLIAAFVAIMLNTFQLKISDFSLQIIRALGSAAIPVALMALGGRFDFSKYEGGRKVLIEALIYRLILIPAVVSSVSVFFGFRGEALALILVLFASPTSVTSYTMAHQMGANEKLAAKLLVYGTTLSSVTLFVFISVYKMLGFF
ncbi:MAG: AEC family transporter [Bacillota bacterium]|nr:AEC family transporter [Bacillota bacterium]